MSIINRTVLMSDALHFSTNQAINPYYGDIAPSVEAAKVEHDSIKQALQTAGVTVISAPSPTDSQDGVYTANWALVRGNKAIVSRLPDVRKAEEEYAASVLASLGKEIIVVPEGLKFSGQGDALACGNLLFCGQGYRSDIEAQIFAAEQLGYTRIQLQTVPKTDKNGAAITNAVSGWADSYFYDIDLALAVLRHPSETTKGLIAYCPEAFDTTSRDILKNISEVDTITVSETEATQAFATNLVSTGETVVMSDSAPQLKANLESLGFTVLTPHVSELAKGGGYIRCTTLSID